MLSNSLRLRAAKFAFIIGPPRLLTREDASRVHASVCDSLGYDEFTLSYATEKEERRRETKGFAIQVGRKEGIGSFAIILDSEGGQAPIRLLLDYTWPPSTEHVRNQFDMTTTAVFDALDGNWQKASAEVRLHGQCAVQDERSLEFLREKLLGIEKGWVDALGSPLTMVSIGFEVDATLQGDSISPKRELKLEVLREDPTGLYVEAMSHWPMVGQDPSGRFVLLPVDKKPSDYVNDSYNYLEKRLQQLEGKGGAQ